MYTFYIDDIEIEAPRNKKDLSIIIERDEDIKGLLINYTSDLELSGTGYDLLRAGLVADGYCGSSNLKIYADCDGELLVEGLIFYAKCLWDENKCIVTATVDDIGYSSYIRNNKNIKVSLLSTRTKNNETGTSTASNPVAVIRPSTQVFFADVDAWSAKTAFEKVIEYISDGEIGFYSPLFDTGGDLENLYITTGWRMQQVGSPTPSENSPTVSFNDLFTEFNKIYNVSFKIDTSTGSPRVYLDYTQNFFDDTTSINVPNIPQLELRILEENIYSAIKFGSAVIQDEIDAEMIPNIEFWGWNEETHHTTGQCNTDATKDLYNLFVLDSNVIVDKVINGSDSHRDRVFLLETDIGAIGGGLPDRRRVKPYTGVSSVIYFNEGLNNYNKAVRHNAEIPTVVFNYSTADDSFSANRGTDSGVQSHSGNTATVIDPFIFGNEISDTNNNYNNITGRYVAPANGVYTFTSTIYIKDGTYSNVTFNDGADGMDATININIYTNTGTLVQTYTNTRNIPNADIVLTFGVGTTGTILMGTNYYAEVSFSINFATPVTGPVQFDYYFDADCAFACEATGTGGGIFEPADPEDQRVFEWSFQYPITYTNFKTLLASPEQALNISKNTTYTETFISRIDWNMYTGISEITTIGNEI